MYFRKAAWLGAAMGVSAAGAAWAQDARPNRVAPEGAAAVEEVVVTARRREEGLQDVPVAVSVVSTQEIRALNVLRPQDLSNVVSGLSAEPGGSSGSTRGSNFNFAIRGQFGSTGVVTYVNEVPNYPSDLFDLSGIQVLKGPQGTLFGAVTTGGAILLQTQMPTDELKGFVDVRYSNKQLADVEFGLGGPIVPGVLSVRIAGIGHTGGSFTRDLYNDAPGDGQDNQALRFTAKLDLGRFENVAMATYARNADQVRLNIPLATVGTDLSGRALSIGGQIPASIAALANISCTPACPTYLAVARQQLAGQAALGHYRGYSNNFGQHTNFRTYGFINKANFQMSDWLTVRDIFSYYQSDTTAAGQAEQDGFLLPLTEVNLPTNKGTRTYTNEIQLQAQPTQTMHVTAGYFLQRSRQPTFQRLLVGQVGGFLSGVNVGYISQASKTRSRNQGLFGQVDWEVVPHLTLTGGARKTWIDSTNFTGPNIFSQCVGAAATCAAVIGTTNVNLSSPTNTLPTELLQIPGMPPALVLAETSNLPQAVRSRTNADKITYTLAAHYKVSDDVAVYVTTRTGYKPGGFSTSAPIGFQQFGPENVTDWEAGLKTRWRMDELAGSMELAVYNDDYKDIQQSVNVIDPVSGRMSRVTQNTGAATIRGFDLDLTARYKAFELSGYFSLTDAHYTDYPNTGQFGTSPPYSTLDLTQQQLAHVSKYRWGLRPSVHLQDMGLGQDVVLSANVYYRSKFTGQNSGVLTPYATLEGRTIADLRAEWRNVADTGLRLAAGVLNAGDYQGLVNVVDFTRTSGYAYGNYQQPRTWYLQAHYDF